MKPKPERIQKYLANLGVASRRAIEEWIRMGRITVNGQLAEIGQSVTSSNRICIDGKPVHKPAANTVTEILAYHKPEGVICTRKDPEGRPTVFDHLPRLKNGRWVAIGRLDLNTSGLLLFTNDGQLANRLMHPSSGIEREYAVRVFGEVNADMIKTLTTGVKLQDGMAKFDAVQSAGGTGMNRWYNVVVTEGKNRIVRRLWESQGVKVSRLHRVGYGCLALPKRLTPGKHLKLSQQDIDALSRLCQQTKRPAVGD